MSVWNAETAVLSPQDKQIERITHFGLGVHLGKTFSLYRFLRAHKGEPGLHRRVLLSGKPLFTTAEFRQVMKGIEAKPKRMTQRGGGSGKGGDPYDDIIDRMPGKLAELYDMVLGPPPPPPPRPETCATSLTGCINEFPTLPGISLISGFLKAYMFYLWEVENTAIAGPLVVGPALDAVTLGIPVASNFLVTFITSFSAVPVIGIFTEIGGMVVGSLLALVTTLLSVSRRQYGTAFKSSLSIIPKLGGALTNASEKAETLLKRIRTRIDGGVSVIESISPSAAAIIDQKEPLTADVSNLVAKDAKEWLNRMNKKSPAFKMAVDNVNTISENLKVALPPSVLEKWKKKDVEGTLAAVDHALAANQFDKFFGQFEKAFPPTVIEKWKTNDVDGTLEEVSKTMEPTLREVMKAVEDNAASLKNAAKTRKQSRPGRRRNTRRRV